MEAYQELLNNDLVEKALAPSFDYQIGDLNFAPSYFQAVAIVFLLFLLVLSFARLRRIYVHWSLKGASSMIFLGFAIAIIVEGFLLLGGRTVLTELLGWENAPKPISTALDEGRGRLIDVLGDTAGEIPMSEASEHLTSERVYDFYQMMTDEEKVSFEEMVCTP